MSHARRTSISAVVFAVISLMLPAQNALCQFGPNQQPSGFLGAWCAQGDPAKRASISADGPMLTLTNENGNTSPGQYQGQNGITAPGWEFVTGTLSADGQRLNWSNGSFWARCDSGGGGRNRLNLTGTWYAQGDRSRKCSVQQRGSNLQLSNETGDTASGQMNGKRTLTSSWNGSTIGGTVSSDGNRINWDNGTYWIRYRLYGSQNN
jgi:hypothetical protein